ncbi:hypothetical protein RJ53_10390 [Methanocalculus chunghsingensis]|uniref:Uncharacterized protein n=1 Tax=Methanocalculus chunghsingensis TaxID=156457 RepID=A0A8J7W9A3_9EURY|nr:hypothetical protein [Methanocalculus chunghsingensis]MBR1369863.1 hypothetical protein [Methanocalculus chunghsingensis]
MTIIDLEVAVEVILRIREEIGEIDIRRRLREISEALRARIHPGGGAPPSRLKGSRTPKAKE